MTAKKILFNALIPLNILLLFFIVFEHRLVIPLPLQVFGRMHPVMLHFPIVLLILVAGLLVFIPKAKWNQDLFSGALDYLILFAALTAVITALMGILLSIGGDYQSGLINWHKWTGIAVPFILFLICMFRAELYKHLVVFKTIAATSCALIMIAGHFGGELTHGEHFVLGPLQKEKENKRPPFDDAFIFADLVQPIIEEKCLSCHNTSKAKGQFIMETKELLLKGGKAGKPWDTTKTDLGIMIRRIHLPEEQKKHMPPAGKPQLTIEEMAIMENWVRKGADFTKKLIELSPSDTLYMIARKTFGSGAEEVFNFAPADNKEISRLSNSNRVISSVADGSPAITVDFFNAKSFSGKAVEELLPLKNNITEINFSNMPFGDKQLPLLNQFKELRKLNLNATAITGAYLTELSSLPALKSLSVASTAITPDRILSMGNFPSLQLVYLWNTAITQTDLSRLEKQHRKVIFNRGFDGDSTVIRLSPPLLIAETEMFRMSLPVSIKHFIKGATIRYTLDGTDPDSVRSPEYSQPLQLRNNTMLRAKAFKKGWYNSDIVRHYYFKQTYLPDSALLISGPPAHKEFKDGRLLIDNDKSEINFSSGKWVQFSGKPMECLLFFNKPVRATNITLSILKDISAAIMPPSKVEVWCGRDKAHLRLLKTVTPLQPMKMDFREILSVECNFPPSENKVFKIVVWPLKKLPDWHQNKGNDGKVFMDEIFVN